MLGQTEEDTHDGIASGLVPGKQLRQGLIGQLRQGGLLPLQPAHKCMNIDPTYAQHAKRQWTYQVNKP